jgi:lipopolysaccharide/colanic/teichoic acid biosynthesis glycosyltransferase
MPNSSNFTTSHETGTWDGSPDPRYKRPLDLFILLSAHLVLAPVFLGLWIAIPLIVWLGDRGPIFFRQPRMGRYGQIMQITKFRTMVPNANELGPVWNTELDSRVTKVGRFLRRTALDELPQTISILRGEMSFVGPRPLAVEEYEYLSAKYPGFAQRLGVRPGLTGLAKVYDKSDLAAEKVRYDREYVQRMSAWLDIKLIVLSVGKAVMGRGDHRQGKGSA